jgi:hypothetical protein
MRPLNVYAYVLSLLRLYFCLLFSPWSIESVDPSKFTANVEMHCLCCIEFKSNRVLLTVGQLHISKACHS